MDTVAATERIRRRQEAYYRCRDRKPYQPDHFIWLAIALDVSTDYLIFGLKETARSISNDEADRLIGALEDIRDIIESQRSRTNET